MRTAHLLALASLLAALPVLGCAAEEPSRAPAQPAAGYAPPPAAVSTVGQTERQAPSPAVPVDPRPVQTPPAPAADLFDGPSATPAQGEPPAPAEPLAPDAIVAVKPDGTPVRAGSVETSDESTPAAAEAPADKADAGAPPNQ